MVRALGVSLGYGHSYFGGTAPLIYEAFKEHGQVMWFIVYVTTLTFISTLIYIFGLKNKAATHLDHEQGHAWAHNE